MSEFTRRDLMRAGLATAAFGLTVTRLGPAGAATARVPSLPSTGPYLPYTTGGFYHSRVDGLPVDESATQVFRHFMKTFPRQRGCGHPLIRGVGGDEWGTPYAMGTAADPVWTLTGTMNRQCAVLRTRGFHAPDWLGSVLTGTSDSPLCVIDQASGYTVSGSQATQVGRHAIAVASAGITYHSSNGLDHRNPRSDDPRNLTSRGRIFDAMVIRHDLVRYGVANHTDLGHVLHLFLVETNSKSGYCNPMVGCEEGKHGFGAEGLRVAIAGHVDLAGRGLSPEGLVVARTLQNYGAYIGDNSGSGTSLRAEQETASHPVWHGRLRKHALAGIRWDDFVVIRRGAQ
jgi:hypothetical protein